MRKLILAAAAAAAALLAACDGDGGGGGGGGGAPPAGMSPETFCSELLDAECEAFDRCFPGVLKLNRADCRVLLDGVAGLSCGAFVDPAARSVAAGRATFDAAGAEACVASLRGDACPGEQWRSLLFACEPTRFFSGAVGPGDPCGSGAECDDTGYCSILTGNCEGVCLSYGLEGDCCAPPCGSAPCAPGLSCAPDASGNRSCQRPGEGACASRLDCAAGEACVIEAGAGSCAPLPAEGEPCTVGTDPPFCLPPFACDAPNAEGAAGTCAARKAAGEPCQASWSCEPGLVCAGIDAASGQGTCAAPRAVGEPCAPLPQGALWPADDCVPTAQCDPETLTCAGPPGLGEPCRTAGGDAGSTGCAEGFCRTAAGSTEGTCTPLLGEGESCATAQQACGEGLFCDRARRTCTGPAPDGAPCERHDECASGRCLSTGEQSVCFPACG